MEERRGNINSTRHTLFKVNCMTRVIAILAAWFFGTIAMLALCSTARADCGHFFRKQVVYQQYVAPVYAVPIVYAAPVYYSAGVEYQIEAAVEKALRLREQAPTKGYQSQVQAHTQAPIQAPHKGSLEPLQSVEVGLFARCIRCHKGDNAKAGLRFDGDYSTTHENYRRYGEIFALGVGIPPEMASVVPQVTAEQRGEMNEWILKRVFVQPAQPAPPADRPPPPPVPDEGGGLQ